MGEFITCHTCAMCCKGTAQLSVWTELNLCVFFTFISMSETITWWRGGNQSTQRKPPTGSWYGLCYVSAVWCTRQELFAVTPGHCGDWNTPAQSKDTVPLLLPIVHLLLLILLCRAVVVNIYSFCAFCLCEQGRTLKRLGRAVALNVFSLYAFSVCEQGKTLKCI